MDQEELATEYQPANPSRPAQRFTGTGGLQVAIWKEKSDQGFDRYTVRAERVYKDDKDGEFKHTNYFRDSDLLRLSQLLENADRWIEQDKGKVQLVSNQAQVRA